MHAWLIKNHAELLTFNRLTQEFEKRNFTPVLLTSSTSDFYGHPSKTKNIRVMLNKKLFRIKYNTKELDKKIADIVYSKLDTFS